MLLNAALAAIPLAVMIALWKQGLWNNALTLVNVITAALVATNYYEPLADLLDGYADKGTYLWDFVSLWVLFAATFLLLRLATDQVSQVKVHFIKPVDRAGGVLMAAWASWILLCFATMTLHTAPLARHFLRGSFQEEPDSKMFFGLSPDHVWLAWVRRESRGTLSRFGTVAPFDVRGDFIMRYSNRRGEFEEQDGFLKSGPKSSGFPTS